MITEEYVVLEDTFAVEPNRLITVRVTVNDCRFEEDYADILLPPLQQQQFPEEFVVLARPRKTPGKAKAGSAPNKMMVVKVRR